MYILYIYIYIYIYIMCIYIYIMCIYREIWCNIILKNVGFIQHILPIFFEMINGLVTLGYVILCYIPIPQPSTGDEMERGRLGNW